jgi:hypothetical protein
MDSILLSERLLDYMEQYKEISKQKTSEITKGTIELIIAFTMLF